MNDKKAKASDFMPAQESAMRVLHERAKLYCQTSNDRELDESGTPYIKFILGNNELYGIEFSESIGVIVVDEMARSPFTPPFIVGIINFHGKMIGVIDLAKVLSIKSSGEIYKNDKKFNIIIVSVGKLLVGISVGRLLMSDSYVRQSLSESLLTEGDLQRGYLKGIHKEKIAILDMEKVLSSIKLG